VPKVVGTASDSAEGRGRHGRWARPLDTATGLRRGLRAGRFAAVAAFMTLAIASPASAGSSGVVHDVGRLSSAGASSTRRTASSTTGAVEPTPACTTRKLTLTDVLERDGHVLLAGTATRSLVGRKVKIIFAGRRQVAATRIGANGLFSTDAPLPPASMRESNSARYFAEAGTERSLDLKLTRRLVLDPPAGSATTVTLSGKVIPPLTDPAAEIVVQQGVSCSKLVPLTRVRPGADGRFHITLKAPSDQHTVTYELSTFVRQSAHSTNDYATYSLPQTVELPPTASTVEPAVGPTPGGTPVTIKGTGFAKGATVTIGAAATSVEVKSETEILAETAAGTGEQEVVVTDVNGSSRSGAKFTYVTPPTVTSIMPAQGSTLGGSEIVIKGSGFVDGSTVTIGGKATVLEDASASEIKADTGATDPGEDQVVVTLPDGVASTSAPGFTYVAPPTVTAISPAEGSSEGGTVVQITGTGFIKGSTLAIGSSPVAFVVVSATEIVAETAATPAGKDEVVVSDRYGASRDGPGFAYVTE
jgi:IPT/TIG domain